MFEYWCNEKSIIPITNFPYFRYRMQNPSQSHSPFIERIKAKGMHACPVKIEGVKHVYYVLDEHLSFLENSGRSISENVHFVAPLDNLLWNRRMISEIFDFNYTWEVYKVPEKRVYGYYVMPVLYGTRLIGRLDPKLDRQNKTMIINSLLLEEKSYDKGFVIELAKTMQRFLKFHDASKVNIVRIQPKELKNSLMRTLNQLREFKS